MRKKSTILITILDLVVFTGLSTYFICSAEIPFDEFILWTLGINAAILLSVQIIATKQTTIGVIATLTLSHVVSFILYFRCMKIKFPSYSFLSLKGILEFVTWVLLMELIIWIRVNDNYNKEEGQ